MRLKHEIEYYKKIKCECGYEFYVNPNKSEKVFFCPKCSKKFRRE